MAEQLLYAAAVPFEAAREVSLLPAGHRSRRLHGHSFTAKVWANLPERWAPFPGAEVDALRESLADALAPLDYQHLNRTIGQPTDENLARWIRGRIAAPDIVRVGVLSTPHEGVDLDRNDQAHVWRRYLLQSAHRLPNVKPGHKCGRMHGHGFEIIVHANQSLGTREIGVDYDHLDELWAPIHAELDHACLNDIPGLENPTSEIISAWIWQRLKAALPELSWVTVYETATCGAHFDGHHYRIWKELSLDSSLRLSRAPTGDRRRRVHGHTYTLRLHLHAPLDKVLGWTVDFGDVKEIFDPVFKLLDHQPLYEIPNLPDNDAGTLVRWIRSQVAQRLPEIDRIDLFETRGCGAILSWGDLGPALPI
jgi:6-pyruvoyltetrahydropterin/6-carboxytetrahydropterin synthase